MCFFFWVHLSRSFSSNSRSCLKVLKTKKKLWSGKNVFCCVCDFFFSKWGTVRDLKKVKKDFWYGIYIRLTCCSFYSSCFAYCLTWKCFSNCVCVLSLSRAHVNNLTGLCQTITKQFDANFILFPSGVCKFHRSHFNLKRQTAMVGSVTGWPLLSV